MGDLHCSGVGPRRVGLIALLALIAGFAIAATSAQASTGYQDQASFGVGAFESSADVAFDPTTGNVLMGGAPDLYSSKVIVFGDPSGSPTVVGEFSVGFPELGGIAVDPRNGDVYASGYGQIARFLPDGGTPPSYTRDTGYSSPDGGTGPGQVGDFRAALAVDPGTGDLLVADRGNHRISRYSPGGAFLGSIEGGAGSSTANPIDLTVQPDGTIDVLNLEGFINPYGAVEGTSEIDRYSSSGALLEAIDPDLTAHAVSLAFDPETQNLFFAREFAEIFQPGPPELVSLHDGAVVEEVAYSRVEGNPRVPALAMGTESRVFGLTGSGYVTNPNQVTVQRFEVVTFPDLTLAEPTAVTATSAHVAGTVDPDGSATEYRFEYSADAEESWTPGPEGSAGEGHGAVPVEGDVQGLQPNQDYLLRLRAFNDKAERTSPTRGFHTLAAPPVVSTGAVSEAAAAEPELLGAVNPRGSQTQYLFEIGPTAAYGAKVPATGQLVAGNGRTAISVAAGIAGLTPGALYHYRLVASNQAGTVYGEDRTFVAGAGSESARAFEMVSPVEKGNVGAATYNESSFARADGGSMLFGSDKASYPGALAGPYIPRNLAVRTPSGWLTRSLDPPNYSRSPGAADFFGVLAISDDQSRALVTSRYALTPDATGGEAYLYILDIASDSYTLVSPIEPGWPDFQSKEWLLGTTPDLRAVAFLTELRLDPEAPPGRHEYLWREGSGLTLISRDPQGHPFESESSIVTEFSHENNPISKDGSRVYFSIQSNQPGGAVYLRENGVTRAISVSHVLGDPATPVPASFVRASADGRYAVFISGASSGEITPPLTSEAPAGEDNQAYLYDAATNELRYLGSNAYANGPIAFPALGRMFYFSSGSGEELLYAEDGQTYVVAGKGGNFDRVMQASDDGRYLAFEARGNVTGYDSGGHVEIYRFDLVTKDVVCVSCRDDGGKALGDAGIGQNTGGQSSLDHHFPQAVLDDGTVFFDTPDPLVGRDVNGVSDVYEYREGQPHLITPGDSGSPANYLEATPDGRNVFFVTNQRLVSQDTDAIGDVYDARVGGGFPAPSGGGECSGRCDTSSAMTPASPTSASELAPGSGRTPKHHQKRKHRSCRKVTKSKKPRKGTHCRRHAKRKAQKTHHHGGAR